MEEKDRVMFCSSSPRWQYMNSEFRNYILKNMDKVYCIERVGKTACKLYKVGFWITFDFLKKI